MDKTCNTCDHKDSADEGWYCCLWADEPSECSFSCGILCEKCGAFVGEDVWYPRSCDDCSGDMAPEIKRGGRKKRGKRKKR